MKPILTIYYTVLINWFVQTLLWAEHQSHSSIHSFISRIDPFTLSDQASPIWLSINGLLFNLSIVTDHNISDEMCRYICVQRDEWSFQLKAHQKSYSWRVCKILQRGRCPSCNERSYIRSAYRGFSNQM